MTFSVNRAVYSLSPEGGFSCSIECESNPQISYAYEPCFCFMRCPVGGSGLHVGQVLRIEHRQGERNSFDLPSTHLYTGVHFDPWDASVTVLAIEGDRIETRMSFLTDDPDYYDERARDASAASGCRRWLSAKFAI